ncbi:unnamed protein product [Heligmosomoides polygyrus]|uniref:Uncharacterized protein n=1 Tax=Heligmosomoides polygyrus TaxID=6339 RepID=A0A183G7R4_HELPZ|nr:unnamed protein product [Heligmosomoides polygyrus]
MWATTPTQGTPPSFAMVRMEPTTTTTSPTGQFAAPTVGATTAQVYYVPMQVPNATVSAPQVVVIREMQPKRQPNRHGPKKPKWQYGRPRWRESFEGGRSWRVKGSRNQQFAQRERPGRREYDRKGTPHNGRDRSRSPIREREKKDEGGTPNRENNEMFVEEF